MSYYTSYETSVALREAGAPQDLPSGYMGGYYINEYPERVREFDRGWSGADWTWTTRAFRLDEILKALASDEKRPDITLVVGASGACNVEAQDDRMPITSGVQGYGDTPVEAAADCWLTALRIAAREVAR